MNGAHARTRRGTVARTDGAQTPTTQITWVQAAQQKKAKLAEAKYKYLKVRGSRHFLASQGQGCPGTPGSVTHNASTSHTCLVAPFLGLFHLLARLSFPPRRGGGGRRARCAVCGAVVHVCAVSLSCFLLTTKASSQI